MSTCGLLTASTMPTVDAAILPPIRRLSIAACQLSPLPRRGRFFFSLAMCSPCVALRSVMTRRISSPDHKSFGPCAEPRTTLVGLRPRCAALRVMHCAFERSTDTGLRPGSASTACHDSSDPSGLVRSGEARTADRLVERHPHHKVMRAAEVVGLSSRSHPEGMRRMLNQTQVVA
jgi:hypothetical protein